MKFVFDYRVVWAFLTIFLAVQVPGDGQAADETDPHHSFTPTLSLQFYVQPFITIGDYTDFKELVEPKSYQFKPYPLNENRDFHRRSLRGNTVLRWEFRPGSTLFVVWSQSREVDLANVEEADLEFRPFHRLRSSFADEGSNIFLIKCRYWFGM